MNLSITNLFKVPEIRAKILITLGLLLVYRIGFFIPLPGVDFRPMLEQSQDLGGIGKIFGIMNALTGGSLQSATIFSLGVDRCVELGPGGVLKGIVRMNDKARSCTSVATVAEVKAAAAEMAK